MTDIASILEELTSKEEAPKVYSKQVLSNVTRQKLLSYQEPHVIKLVSILVSKHIALDASDTGIGKTYIASAVCRELGRRPIIICPKTLIYTWNSVLSFFGVKSYDIVNYETLRNGKTYSDSKYKYRTKCPYLDLVDPDPNNLALGPYEWDVPKDSIIIFDEAHRCKSPSKDSGKLLSSAKQLVKSKVPVLLLSATICEKFTDVKIPFYLFGIIPYIRNFNHYVLTLRDKYPRYRTRKSDYLTPSDYLAARENAQAMTIYEEIREYTSRIKIKDLGDKFPSNQICCQQFFAEDYGKIQVAYEEIALLMEELKNNPGKNHLAQIQKRKQEIELMKVPIFIEQAQLYLDDEKSVIIFVNYLHTLRLISEQLDIRCKIFGEQSMEERHKAIDLFQSNQERIIICQIRAGGTGISLHDLSGNHPRITLMNFPDSGSNLLQALGRAPRAGAKSTVLQRIIFVANVDYEKKIMQNINRKLTNISAINDGDLDGHKYLLKRITRKVVPKVKN